MTNNTKIGIGVLALIATYFLAMKLISNAAKDDPKKECKEWVNPPCVQGGNCNPICVKF